MDVQSIDKSLLRLDTEIRKTGRISRREIEEILDDIRQMSKKIFVVIVDYNRRSSCGRRLVIFVDGLLV